MKRNIDKVRCTQIFIVLTCLIILTVWFSTEHSTAQACLPNDPPPLFTGAPPYDPPYGGWDQGITVSVKIFDRTNNENTADPAYIAELNAIDLAIREWNAKKVDNCSQVTFSEAIRAHKAYEGEPLPDNTIFVVRNTDQNGEFEPNYSSFSGLRAGYIYMHSDFNLSTFANQNIAYVAKHEAGHSLGVGNTVMSGVNKPLAMYSENTWQLPVNEQITTCDTEAVKRVYCPTPTPTPTPPVGTLPNGGVCQNVFDNFTQAPCPYGFTADTTGYYCCRTGCPLREDDPTCVEQRETCEAGEGIWKGCCRGCFSPIVIDVEGNGFNLTDGNNGVMLDLTGEGTKDKISWTAADSDDAWLVLDRNNNGTVDNALELFGNFTAQDQSIPVKDRNGFYALAEYDKSANGGNADGRINRLDTVYDKLRLWQDKNHNGISEPAELKTLQDLDVRAIFLDFKVSKRKDEHGNRFVYRARVRDKRDADVGKWAWDVFLVKPK